VISQTHLFSTWGKLGKGAFRIWVIGFFSISVIIAAYFIEHKLGRGKTDPTVALINDNHESRINDYSLSFVPF